MWGARFTSTLRTYMIHRIRSFAHCFVLLVILGAWFAPAHAQDPAPPTAANAQEVLELLQDDGKREALEQALAVLANPELATASGAGTPPPPTGLISQSLRALHQQFDRALQQWHVTHQTFSESRVLLTW